MGFYGITHVIKILMSNEFELMTYINTLSLICIRMDSSDYAIRVIV